MRKAKLDTPIEKRKPKFRMEEPNDDAAAYGWALGKLRYPTSDSKPGDIWPGNGMFSVAAPIEVRQTYGHTIDFVCPAFLQLLLDASPAIREGAEKARAAKYSTAALAKYKKTVMKVFEATIIPEIERRFEEVAGAVAEFYAARLAHIDTFGVEE